MSAGGMPLFMVGHPVVFSIQITPSVTVIIIKWPAKCIYSREVIMRNENKEIIKQRIQHSFDRWQEHFDASDIVYSVTDAQQALEAARKIHNSSLEAEAYYLMSQSHYLLNNYDMILKLVQKALRLHESIGCTIYLAEDGNVMGIVYSKIHEMDKAIECYKMSIRYNPDTPRPYNSLAQHLNEKKGSRQRSVGSWYGNAKDCRVANRYSYYPDRSPDYLGFRLSRSSK